jgi:microcystin-dependent protein
MSLEKIVILWSGSLNTIPDGWFICDGTNGTPDLRNRFVVGVGSSHSFNSTGGFADSIVPTHNHSVTSVNTGGNHGHSMVTYAGNQSPGAGTNTFGDVNNAAYTTYAVISSTAASFGNHSHTGGVVNNAGTTSSNSNFPPYLSLFYIMKGGS